MSGAGRAVDVVWCVFLQEKQAVGGRGGPVELSGEPKSHSQLKLEAFGECPIEY